MGDGPARASPLGWGCVCTRTSTTVMPGACVQRPQVPPASLPLPPPAFISLRVAPANSSFLCSALSSSCASSPPFPLFYAFAADADSSPRTAPGSAGSLSSSTRPCTSRTSTCKTGPSFHRLPSNFYLRPIPQRAQITRPLGWDMGTARPNTRP